VRVAIVNTARNYGGQEAMAALLAEHLAARGHDVVFLCRPIYPALERVRRSVPVATVLDGVDWSPRAIWRARRTLTKHATQVVLVTTNKDMRTAALSAWSLGIPVVVRRAMARPLRGSPHYRFLYGRIPAHIVTNSHATRRIMLDSAPWLHPERTSVIHNGIDPRPFREGPPADLGLPAGAVVVGFVGRFVEWKGVLTLADAWRSVADRLPGVHLVLAGAGEVEGEMRARLDGVERVHWIGFRNDVAAVMKALDVLAFPSTMEGFGIAAMEAMAAGVPVIAARAAALPEVVAHEREGLLVPPRDPVALAGAIERLATDAALRGRLGAAGRERVDREFTVDWMVDQYEHVLGAAAAARASGSGQAPEPSDARPR
jgi:glycosyltransferase involved in cell wall biosynthesis